MTLCQNFRKIKNNKKGNLVVEGLTIIIVLAVFAILSLYSVEIFDETNADIQNNSDMHQEAKDNIGNLKTIHTPLMDDLFLFMFVLIVLFVLASVFFIDSYPIFFIISIMLFIGALIVALILGNAYDAIANDSSIAGAANTLTYTGWIMRHILETVLAVGFATAIALFAKIKTMG